MTRWLVLIALCAALSACGGPLKFLTGGGPNVAANVQAGKTNTQTVGTNNVTEQKITRPKVRTIEQSTGPTEVRTERVETIVVRKEVPPWIWITWALLLMLDSPLRWPGQIIGAFRK